jgi:hypothetical protein
MANNYLVIKEFLELFNNNNNLETELNFSELSAVKPSKEFNVNSPIITNNFSKKPKLD